ncbi:MAG: glycosyltransferase family 4 protein [Vulcanimicrobiota bacterium]
MKRKDLLIICEYFHPDLSPTSTLITELAEDLVKNEISTDVFCAFPSYIILSDRDRHVSMQENYQGIGIRRFKYPNFNKNKVIGRLLNYFSFTFFVFINFFSLRSYTSILLLSNPPLLPYFGYLSKIVFKNRFIFLIHDTYPDNAIAIGAVKKSSVMVKMMNHINRCVFKHADSIVVLGKEMKKHLVETKAWVREERITVIPNWADRNKIKPRDKKNPFSERENLSTKFVVTYTGNIGVLQDLEIIVECANMLKNNSDIVFLFVGEGAKKEKIIGMVNQYGLTNVKFYGFKKGEEYLDVLASSDCLILTLEKCIEGLAVPSKFYTYLASGRSIIAIISQSTDIGELVENEPIGFRIDHGDLDSLSERIMFLYNNPSTCNEMAVNARKIFEESFEREKATQQYVSLIRNLVSGERILNE